MARGGLQPHPRSRPAITARDVGPVVPWLSRRVECREAPLRHPGDKRLRGQAADVYAGRRLAILTRRVQIKRRTLAQRKRENFYLPLPAAQQQEISLPQSS